MPTLASIQIPKPKSWEEFEVICWELFRKLWNHEEAQRHGRQGQPQHGIDVYGRPEKGTAWKGVQCKGKDASLDKAVSATELKREVEKAKKFDPSITGFILVTTAPRDAKIQKTARAITEEHQKRGLFTVDVWGWEDITERLASHPEILQRHWPQFFQSSLSKSELKETLVEVFGNALTDKAQTTTTVNVGRVVVADTINISQASLSQTLETEHQAEVDQAKALIDSRQPKAALVVLERLKQRIWGQTTTSIKFRILTNMGACHLNLNQLEKAANLFLEALQYNPEDEKALSNAAMASYLNNDSKEAKNSLSEQ